MSDGALVRMADILAPPPPAEPAAASGWLAAVLVAALLTAVWLWRRRSPLRRLARDLARGRLAPRDAAHRLARLVAGDAALRGELDRLRFRRHAPAPAAVAALIRRSGHGR